MISLPTERYISPQCRKSQPPCAFRFQEDETLKHSVWLLFASVIARALSTGAVEPLVVRGDWPAVTAAIRADPASMAAIANRLLLAHSSLAANDVNSAFCGFS